MGQPKDTFEAEKMLKSLSGRSHQVLTAIGCFAVLNEGRLTKPRPTAGLTMDEIGLMMGGAHGMEVAHHVE